MKLENVFDLMCSGFLAETERFNKDNEVIMEISEKIFTMKVEKLN